MRIGEWGRKEVGKERKREWGRRDRRRLVEESHAGKQVRLREVDGSGSTGERAVRDAWGKRSEEKRAKRKKTRKKRKKKERSRKGKR